MWLKLFILFGFFVVWVVRKVLLGMMSVELYILGKVVGVFFLGILMMLNNGFGCMVVLINLSGYLLCWIGWRFEL